VYRLSTTLVSRLVLNLREQNSALRGLPTLVTVETPWKFRAVSPAVEPMTFRENTSSVGVDMSVSGMVSNSVDGGIAEVHDKDTK
jgi:hypothetical protein